MKTVFKPKNWIEVLRNEDNTDHFDKGLIHYICKASIDMDIVNNHSSICTFLRAQVPQHTPNCFLSMDRETKQPIILHNLSTPLTYKPNSKSYPNLYAFSDSDFNTTPALIKPSEIPRIFEVKKSTIPNKNALLNDNLNNDSFKNIKPLGDTTGNGNRRQSGTDFDAEFNHQQLIFIHPLVAADVIEFIEEYPEATCKDLYEVITKDCYEEDKFNTTWCDYTLFFLWLMINGDVDGVDLSHSRNKKETANMKTLALKNFVPDHKANETKDNDNNPEEDDNTSGNMSNFNKYIRSASEQHKESMEKLTELARRQVCAAETSSKNKSAFHSFNENRKVPFIRAQMTDDDLTFQEEASESVQSTFSKKNMSEVFSTINHVLEDGRDTGTLMLGQCGNIMTNGLIWSQANEPSGFTVFAFHPENEEQVSSKLKVLVTKERAQSKLDDNDIQTLMNDSLFLPTAIADYRTQIQSYLCLAMDWWSNKSLIANLIQMEVNEVEENQCIYRSYAKADSTFFIKLGYTLDLVIQRLLRAFRQAQSPDEIDCDTYARSVAARHTAVVSGTFSAIIPPNLIDHNNKGSDKKRSSPDSDTTSKDKETQKKSRKEQEPFDGSTITKDEWVLPSERAHQYQSLFTKEVLKRMPKAKNPAGNMKPYCNKAMVNKKCKWGDKCPFIHEKPSKQGKEEEVDAFYASVYA